MRTVKIAAMIHAFAGFPYKIDSLHILQKFRGCRAFKFGLGYAPQPLTNRVFDITICDLNNPVLTKNRTLVRFLIECVEIYEGL